MATFLRRDDWVTDAMGNALSGASVYVCSQPATTTSIPPSPLQQLYADSAGITPITQPVLTDGYGHAAYYVTPGTYTVVYYSPQILETILPDQTIGSGNVAFPITIPEGGTNATTAAQALINLGAAANGANSDITSLSAVGSNGSASTTSTFNLSGWQFGAGNFGATNAPLGKLASQSWTGSGFTGLAFGVQDAANNFALLTTSGLLTSGQVQGNTVTSLGNGQINGTLSLGPATTNSVAIIVARGNTNNSIKIGGASITGTTSVMITSGTGPTPISGTGLLAFDTNYPTQTTVGAAGAASALPGVPRGYLQFVEPGGVVCVMPYWKAS